MPVVLPDTPIPQTPPSTPLPAPPTHTSNVLVLGVGGGVGATSVAAALGVLMAPTVRVLDGSTGSCSRCRADMLTHIGAHSTVVLVCRSDTFGLAVELASSSPNVTAIAVSQLTDERAGNTDRLRATGASGRWTVGFVPYVRNFATRGPSRKWNSSVAGLAARLFDSIGSADSAD